MNITLTEIPKNTPFQKTTCPHCKKKIHSVGFTKGSKCEGITVVCKFCGRTYSIKAEQ